MAEATPSTPNMAELKQEIATVDKDILFPSFDGILRNLADDTLLTRGGGEGLKIYDNLERDGSVYGYLGKRKLAVTARPWEVVPGGPGRKEKKAAELVKTMLEAVGFDRLCKNLMDAVLKGFAVAEILWETDGATVFPREIKAKNQRRFHFAADGSLRLLTPQDMYQGEPVPDRKFIVHTFGDKDGSPYGLGLGTRLFWYVLFKREDFRSWLLFLDKFASPTAVGKYPHGAQPPEQQKLLDALAAIARDAGVIIPEGMTVELLEAQRSTAGSHEAFCRYLDEQIGLIILGDAPGAKDSGGALASAAILRNEVRLELVADDADLLSATLNQTLLRWITELNVPGAIPPTVWRDVKPAEDLKARSERDKNISSLGYRPTLKTVQESYGGEWEPIPGFGTAKNAPADKISADNLPDGNSPDGADASAFAEGGDAAENYPDQLALDDAADNLPVDELDQAMRAMLKPVVQLLAGGGSPEDAMTRLEEIYPDLDATALATQLARAMFVAKVWGRLAADAETGTQA
jgi:phage gp29-like protein